MSDLSPLPSHKAIMQAARERALNVVREVVSDWRSDRWPGLQMAEQERMLAARAPIWIGPGSVAAGTHDIMSPLSHAAGQGIPVEDIARLSDLLTARLQEAGLLAMVARRANP